MIAFLSKLLKKPKETSAPELPPAEAVEAAPAPPAAAAETGDKLADLPLTEIIQYAWGEGFGKVGNGAFILPLITPLGLDAQKSVLNVNADLGGVSRAIADKFKTYVTGMERNAEIAAEGMRISARMGLAKRVPIQHYDPETFENKKTYDAILGREWLFTFADKDKMMERMSSWLKPRGQIVMTDFVCDKEFLSTPAVKEWIAGEPYGAHPLSGAGMITLFGNHDFDLRVHEDIGKDYKKAILLGLARLVSKLQGKKLNPESKKRVGLVVDFWIRRLLALEAGARVIRYYAIKNAPRMRGA